MSKSFIQTAIEDGRLKMWHSYRSGSFADKSGNGNNGTPTDVNFTGDGLAFNGGFAVVKADSSAELSSDEYTVVVSLPNGLQDSATGSRILVRSDDTAIDWQFYYTTNPSIRIFDGTNISVLNVDLSQSSYCAASIVNGEKPNFYSDGSFVGEGSIAVAISASDVGDFYIGNRFEGSRQSIVPFGDILIFNVELTETEHAQLYGELSGMTWNKHPYITSFANLRVDPNEPGLVAGYDMVPVGGTLPDVAGVNDGAIAGPWFEETVLGPSMAFDGVGQVVNLGDVADFKRDSLTLSMWVKPKDTVSTIQPIFSSGASHWYAGIRDTNRMIFSRRNSSETQITYNTSGSPINPKNWNHLVYTAETSGSSVTTKMFANGEEVFSVTDAAGWGASYGTVWVIGGLSSASLPFSGKICATTIYSDAKDQSWVTQQYNKGKTALWKTGYGVNESVSAVTGGPLENSPFYVQSGGFKISSDTIDGNDVKVIECTSSGVCYVPTSYFSQTATEAAFGGWRFWVKKADASNLVIVNVASVVGTATNGNNYNLIYRDNETIDYRRQTGTAIIDGGATTYPVNTWHLFEIKRIADKTFELLANGNSIGTATDANFLISNFMDFDLDPGDKIALGDPTGKYSIIKSVLP
jgi:hypothetical protein